MGRCQECGEPVSEGTCPACGGSHEEGNSVERRRSDGVSRRGMLTYGGGSALLTWLAAGTGWYVFIHEPTSPEEAVVREYVEALDRAHFYTAAGLFHDNAPGEAWGPGELPDVNRVELAVEQTEVVDRETDVDLDGVEELALVHADISIDDGRRSNVLYVAFVVALNDDGEWRLWDEQ